MLLRTALITCCILSLAGLVGVLVACGQHKDSADDKMQKELTGTWMFEARYARGGTTEHTITVAPDGTYVHAITVPSPTNSPRPFRIEGTVRVEGGFLVDTVTKHSHPNAQVPSTNRSRIVRIDGRELVLENKQLPGAVQPTNQLVYLKQSKPPKSPAALEKAKKLELSYVKYDGLPLAIVITMLHDESVKRDAARKGLTISLGPDAKQLADVEINLELKDVTLAETLERVADSVGLKVQANDTEILLVWKKAKQ